MDRGGGAARVGAATALCINTVFTRHTLLLSLLPYWWDFGILLVIMPSAASPSWAEWMEDTLRTYTGFPRPKTPDFRLFWSDEAAFKRTLRIGKPVVVTLVVPGEASCHAFEEELRKASAEFYRRVIFLQVNCAEATDFCRSRAPTQLPWTEVFVPVVEVRAPVAPLPRAVQLTYGVCRMARRAGAYASSSLTTTRAPMDCANSSHKTISYRRPSRLGAPPPLPLRPPRPLASGAVLRRHETCASSHNIDHCTVFADQENIPSICRMSTKMVTGRATSR